MDIVEELRQNREKGAKRLVSEYKAGLMSLALRFCRNRGDAEELVNRTFAEVVNGIDGYLEQSAFFGWMCQILTNLHAKDCRRKSHEMEVFPGDIPDIADEAAEGQVYKALDASLLRDAVESLPPEIKKAVVLHYFVDMPVRDIAKFLSIPFGTVARRLYLARQMLAAKMGAAAHEVAKKPGAKTVLLALLLCGLTALGAAVWNLAVNQPSTSQPSNLQPSTSQPSNLQPSNLQPSTSQPSTFNKSQGETMDITKTTRAAAMLAAATVATSAAIPATAGADPPSATPITAYSGGFTLDTRPSPQDFAAPIEPFSTMPLAFVITIR